MPWLIRYRILNSTDGGKSWNAGSADLSRFFPKAVFIDKYTGFLTANSGLPWKTIDGGMTWNEQVQNIAGSISHLKFVSLTCGFAIASGKMFKTSDGGSTWLGLDTARFSNMISFDMIDSLYGWATDINTAYKTTDGGSTWNAGFIGRGISIYRGVNFYDGRLGVIAEARNNNNDASNYITVDSGKTWTGYTMPGSVSSYSKVQFTDYQHGWLVEQGGVWRTVDTGKTWAKIYWDSTYYIPWGFDFVDSLHGWYVNDKARFTSDGGNTWSSSPLPYGEEIEDVHFISLKKGFAVGYYGSIFSTTDGGWTWQSDSHNSSVPLFSISEVRDNNVSNLWVGGDSFVVEYMNTATTRAEIVHSLPKQFLLNQNYPNPFNPSTIISYQLPTNGFVTLELFDILGRQVKTLVNERQTAGTHSVTFNASNLSSGVYFYRLTAGSYVQTKKLMLIK